MVDRDAVCAIVRRAGDAIMALHGNEVTKKADGSPVSSADRLSHEMLVAALQSYGLPVVSEEGAPVSHGESLWLIDPLDGTKDFLAGRPNWSVMVALVEKGLPILGVVYAPALGKVWSAEKGTGAYVEDESGVRRIHVSARGLADAPRALMSYSHATADSEARMTKLGFSIQRLGSVGVKLGIIAEGEAEAYWTDAPLKEWDVSAPQIILEEAGGCVTDIRGNSITYSGSGKVLSGCVASNSIVHTTLLG
jgi:3'(2'), 5'-bisphosphate nucleotidase